MTGSIIVLSDIEEEADRLRAIGTYRAAVILGVLIGPVIGGGIAEWVGFRGAFIFQVMVAAAASAWSWLRLPKEAPHPPEREHTPTDAWSAEMWALLKNADLILVSLVTFSMFFTLTGSRQAIIPLLGEDRLATSAGELGLLFGLISVSNLVTLLPASRLGRRFGPKPVIVASGLVTAASLVTFSAAQDGVSFALAGVAMGVGTGLASPTTASYAAGVAPARSRGSAIGLYQAIGDSGFVVGPLALGWMAAGAGFGAGLVANAALSLGLAIVFAIAASARRAEVPLTEQDARS